MFLEIVLWVLIMLCVLVVGTLCVALVSCVYHWFVVVPCSVSLIFLIQGKTKYTNKEQRTRTILTNKNTEEITTHQTTTKH
jgi:hypothetical protein